MNSNAISGLPAAPDDIAARLSAELGADAVQPSPPVSYQGDRAVRAPQGTSFVLVLPEDVAGVQATLRIASETGTTVVPRGAGTGLSGGSVPTEGAIVLGLERLTAVREIDPVDEIAVVEAGVITADLSTALAPHGFFYAPDPASAAISTIGGNIATNAGGLHCAKYGVTRESVLALEVVLADGTLLRTGHRTLKGVTGLDLTQLIIGSEGTLAVVTAATVRIRPVPVARRTVLARFPGSTSAADGVGAISRSPVRPAATELIDAGTLADIDAHTGSTLARGTDAVLLIELDGYGIAEQTADLTAALVGAGGEVRPVDDETEAEHLWELRRSGRGTGAGGHRLGEDIAVPTSRLGEILGELAVIGERHGVRTSALAHAGDGNLHPLLALDREEPEGGSDDASSGTSGSRVTERDPNGDQTLPPALLAAADDLVRAALDLGGTISGEHGIGTAKRGWLDLELSSTSRALQRRLKDAFDPQHLLNPGKAL